MVEFSWHIFGVLPDHEMMMTFIGRYDYENETTY